MRQRQSPCRQVSFSTEWFFTHSQFQPILKRSCAIIFGSPRAILSEFLQHFFLNDCFYPAYCFYLDAVIREDRTEQHEDRENQNARDGLKCRLKAPAHTNSAWQARKNAATARAVGVNEQSYYRWRKEYEGLQLRIQPAGSRQWRFAYKFDGKQKKPSPSALTY